MANIVKELEAPAKELCELGNSKEQAEGHGIPLSTWKLCSLHGG
jgi:hypothetical protein